MEWSLDLPGWMEDGLVRTAWGRAAAMRCPDRPRTVRATEKRPSHSRALHDQLTTAPPGPHSLSLSLSCGASAELILFSASWRRRARIPFFSSLLLLPFPPSFLPPYVSVAERGGLPYVRACD